MIKKRPFISVFSLLLVLSFLFSCASGKGGGEILKTDKDDKEDKEQTTLTTPQETKPSTDKTEGARHPAAAPREVPDYIKNLSSFSEITGSNYVPISYNARQKAYVEGYTGAYDNIGRIRLDKGSMRYSRANLLMKNLSINIDSVSAFYISSPELEVNIFIDGQNTLSSNSAVTLNNNSGMNESTMNYNLCSTLRIMGVEGKSSDVLSLVSSSSRSSVAGRIVVNNCTLDLSGAELTSYGNICIESGGKVIFPDGSVISLSGELDYGVYFSCDYAKRQIKVYCSDENKKIDIDIGYSTGKNIVLSGKSGEISLDMPTPGAALSMDDDFHMLSVLLGGNEISPLFADGSYIFYLPKGADLDNISLVCRMGEGYRLSIGDNIYDSPGEIKLKISEGEGLEATFFDPVGMSYTQSYRFILSSTNVLYLQIDESKGTISQMNTDRAHGTYCYGSLSYAAVESANSFESFFSIRGRGNATWDDEKKGYAIKLYNSDLYEEKNKVDISGMGRSSSWVLVANHRDRTLIRNALAYTLAKELGMASAVDYVFVDLYMNGRYLGLYMLVEKAESGENKVEIEEAAEDNLSGGYLLEFDNYDDTPQIRLKITGARVTVNSPGNLKSYKAIEALLNEANAAIQSSDGYNRATNKYWYDYIDINSFAALWMVKEYTMDFDATVNFRFYYDPSDNKFHGGPAWDFDNSMARTNGVYADPYFALIESGDRNRSSWLTQLMKFDMFRDAIVSLYNDHSDLFTTESDSSIYSLAIRLKAELETSINQNFERWSSQLGYNSWNMPDEATYEGHFKILTDFLIERNNYWSEYIPSLSRY